LKQASSVFVYSDNRQAELTRSYEESGFVKDELVTLQKRNGQVITCRYNGIINKTDQVITITLKDITQRIIMQERIDDFEHALLTALSTIDDSIIIINKYYIIEYQNKSHIDIRGFHINKVCYKVFHDRDKPCVSCRMQKAILSGEVQKEFEPIQKVEDKVLYFITIPIKGNGTAYVKVIEVIKKVDPNDVLFEI